MSRTTRAAILVLAAGALLPASAGAQGTYTWRNAEIVGGGFVPGIIFNTSEPDLVYARTDIGGAYRWNPAAGRWVPLLDWVGFDEWNLTGVDSIATDPVDPNRVYVLAGTYTNVWTNMNGAVLRSTNRGNTWQRTMLPFKVGGNMPGRNMGERLAVDPNRNATLYLGARSGNGLWRSTDFGVTWARVTSFPTAGTFIPVPGDVYQGDIVGVAWIVFDPRSGTPGNATQTIYVGVADKGNSVFRSTNGGQTWSAVPGQPTGFLPHHGVLSSTGMLYVTYSDGAGPYDGQKGDVYRLDTSTGVWTLISPVPSTSADDYFGYGGLAVDAQRPNTIMVAALNSWWPDTILFRSLDAGATWTRIWDWAAYPSRTFRYTQDIAAAPWLNFNANPQPPELAPKLGWMVGDLEIDPFNSNRMLYGTGATIYGTDNLGAWDTGGQIRITVRAQGLEETAVLDLVSPPAGASLLSGLGDICGFRHDNLSAVPARMFGSPTMTSTTSLDFAELTPNFVVRVGNADTANGTRRVGFTFDGGTSWFQGQEPGGVTGGGTVAAAANASRVVWSPEGANVHFSTNNGSSWTQSQGIPAGARVAADRVNPMKFYGFVNGTFYVSTNGGANFAATAATGLPAAGSPVRFKAVAGREGDIWLAGGAEGAAYGLWRSTNSGASFTKLAGVEEADTIGFGAPAPGQTYPALYSSAQVGGVRGIFRSDDAGASWVRINDDQHQYGATTAAITGDPRVFGRVYLATNGRGVIIGEPGSSAGFSLSASPASLTVNRGASGTSTVTVTRSGGFGAAVAFSASGLPAGVTASFSPASTTAGSTVVTLSASSTAAAGPATVTITGSGGGLTRTTSVALTVNAPDFALSVSPAVASAAPGTCASFNVSIVRTGGFTAAVVLSSSQPPGVGPITFTPSSVTGTSSVLSVCVPAATTSGTFPLTITGTGGGLTRTATASVTVASSGFSLAASPGSLSVSRGASGTSTIAITRTGGFAAAVALSASGLPAGVTATFNPASATGSSATLTLAASATAAAGTSTVTVTGTAGGQTRTATVGLTVVGDPPANVTVTPVVAASGPWFNEEVVRIDNTATLTALSVTIVIQRTPGVSFSGQYNTVGGQVLQASSSTASAVTYTFTLAAGQTLGAGTNRSFAAQASGQGTAHPTAGDTFTVTYTVGGQTFTQSGHF